MNRLCILASVLVCCLASDAVGQTYVLETGVSQEVDAVNTFRLDYGTTSIKRWFALAAEAPILPSQSDVRTTISPSGAATRESGPLKRAILSTGLVNGNETRIQYEVRYHAVLHSRKLIPASRNSIRNNFNDLTGKERRLWLRSDESFYDFEEKSFQEWLDLNRLHRATDESDLNFARRVFDCIKSSFEYGADKDANQNASAVCNTKKAHCGGQSTLFVSALRANGIPARSLVGKWAQSMKKGEVVGNYEFSQQHVKAEFFAKDIGWIPVDQSVGLFGSDNGDFIVFQVDYEFCFDTKDYGEQKVPWFWHTVYAVPEGKLANPKRTEDWQVSKKR